MYVVEITFDCFSDTQIVDVERAINGLMDALRYHGQILGREFPIAMNKGRFSVRVVCPEKDSLHPRFYSSQVKTAVLKLSAAGLLSPKIKVLGLDINSEQSAENTHPSWQLLYSTFVHISSPLRCGQTFSPIPLYKIPSIANEDHQALIKWQTQWQSCDEIQMIGGCQAEFAALDEIQKVDSLLFQQGIKLRCDIEQITKIPTYYYQYRVGGNDLLDEQQRLCPMCGSADWQLDVPLHDIFHFKCISCRLVSNLSWDFQ